MLISYISSLLILLSGVFVLFRLDIFEIENEATALYVRISSFFIITVAFILCWYSVNLQIRNNVSDKAKKYAFDLFSVDIEKISHSSLPDISEKIAQTLEQYEYCQFWKLGICVPFGVIFFALCSIGIYKNHTTLFAYCSGCFLLFVLIKLLCSILNLFSITQKKHKLRNVLRDIAYSVKGIQFYNSQKFIDRKLSNAEKRYLNDAREYIQKAVWRSFARICFVFLLIIVIYIANEEYISTHFLETSSIDIIYLSSLFAFTLFLSSFFHWKGKNIIGTCDISRYGTPDEAHNEETPQFEFKNLFIAVHGVYFQDPTESVETPTLQNLTFSVLPGEFIAITGDEIVAQNYIFDLLCGFYKPQSGQIYIAGKRMETYTKAQVRSIIGIFDERFGLIRGTIYDNLSMIVSKNEDLYNVLYNTGLEDCRDMFIFDGASSKLAVPQDTLFRIQIARIALRKPKILLIKTPTIFQNKETEAMFYEFVEFYSKRCTILIRTRKATPIIYSDKILFLSQGEYLFGSHAELSQNKIYQNFIKNI